MQPPRPPRRLLPRTALIERLLQARARRCVLVQGPAGSGKTCLAAAWRLALLAQDVDVAWLGLCADDDAPQRFCAGVLASLARVDPELVRPAAQLLERADDADADELWVITLVQSLGARGRELVLVLDDLHHMTHPRIAAMLQWMLDYAPARFQLACLTRSAAPMALQRWRTQGQLEELAMDDLRLSPQESARFLRDHLGGVTQREATRLHEVTDGWVAGLKLLALEPAAAGARPGASAPDNPYADTFAGYFEREVLQRLRADDLALLMHCALSQRFCASLCAALLQRPDVAQVARQLGALVRADLFVSRVAGADAAPWYQLHPLLREVLLQRLGQHPGVDLQRLHAIAWRWFDARGAIDEAVRHAVQAGEPQAGADLIEAHAQRVVEQGGLAQLGMLVRRLPPEVLRQRFRLRLWMAQLRLVVRNLPAVEADLATMDKEVARNPTPPPWQLHGLTVLRAGLAMQRDDTDAMAAMQADLEAIPDDADPFAVARRGASLAWLHMHAGDYALARQRLDEAERVDIGQERRLAGDVFRGMALAYEGRLADAETLLRVVLEQAEQRRSIDGMLVCAAAGLLSDALYEGNALAAARALIEPRIELIERSVIPDILLRAMLVLSATHWTLGNRLEALSIAQRLEDHALRDRLDRTLGYALLLQLRWQLRERRLGAAQALLQRIETLAGRCASNAPGAHAQLAHVAGRARAAMALHWNDFARAREQLEQVLASAEAARRWREVAMTRMQLVFAARGQGRAQEAGQQLDAALRLGHRMGLVRSLLDAAPGVPALLQEWRTQATAAADPVLAFYAGRLLDAADEVRALADAARASAPDGATVVLSERETAVLALVAQALPNKKIARALDVTPHTVKFHLRNVYLKLGVSERDEALARWRALAAAQPAPRPGRGG